MATGTLIKHGTDRGYRTEIKTGTPCARCQNAHRVYQTQFRPKGRKAGLKYDSDTVIDHLYKQNVNRTNRSMAPTVAAEIPVEPSYTAPTDTSETETEPSLGDRLAERIRAFTVGPNESEYVSEEDYGYVHPIDGVDESPGPEWAPAEDTEFIINAAGLKVIEQNLGTYLSVVGITVEMIDPYCGPILAENFDNMVKRWSKVIAHYPKAADLFLDGKGGVIFTWIGALQATWPILFAFYKHHLAKTVMVKDGRIYNKNAMPNSNGQVFDPLQPDFQYSAS